MSPSQPARAQEEDRESPNFPPIRSGLYGLSRAEGLFSFLSQRASEQTETTLGLACFQRAGDHPGAPCPCLSAVPEVGPRPGSAVTLGQEHGGKGLGGITPSRQALCPWPLGWALTLSCEGKVCFPGPLMTPHAHNRNRPVSPAKGQIRNLSGFTAHVVSVPTTQFCCCGVKIATHPVPASDPAQGR